MPEQKHTPPSNNLTWIILTIFIVAIIACVIFLSTSGAFKKFSHEVDEELEQKRSNVIK